MLAGAPTRRKAECVDGLDLAGASSAVSGALNADDRSLQRPRWLRRRLPRRAPLTTLFCNANASTWAGPSLALLRTLIFRVITPRDPRIRGPRASRCLPHLMRRWGGGLWNASGTAPHVAISATVGAATGCFHSRVLSVTFGAVPSGHVYRISLALIFADKCSQSRCVGPLSLRGCYTKAHLL